MIAVIPSTENMPGGRAQKPGDVQIAMSGKSIEVINTDAEGRLILADGIAYAKQLGATHLVDAATLTGAIVVALGAVNTGVFGTDEAFTERVLASAQGCGREDVAHAARRRLPRPDQEHHRRHPERRRPRGRRYRRAAWFLREFTGDTPWVHLDIAGTAWLDDAKPWGGKGGTGVGVRTLVDLAMNLRGFLAPRSKPAHSRYIFSGASMPSRSSAATSCRSTRRLSSQQECLSLAASDSERMWWRW